MRPAISDLADPAEDKSFPSPYSVSIVEGKRGTWTNQDIVDGRAAAPAVAPPATEQPLPALSPIATGAPQSLSPRAPVFVPRDRQPSGPSPPAPKPSFTAGLFGTQPPPGGRAGGGLAKAARPSAPPEAARTPGLAAQPPAPKTASSPPAQPRGLFSQAPPQEPAARAPSLPAPAAAPAPAPVPATPPAARRRAHLPRLLTALTDQLLAEGVGRQVDAAAQEALQHEHRRRLRERRRELINVLAAQVCGVVVAPPLRAYAESAARDAAANVFYRRAALRRALGSWRRAHARVADEARQTQRLHDVRSDLARRRASIHAPLAPPAEHAAPRKMLSDNQLRSQYTSAKQRYDRLWRGGTFADALVEHLAWLSAETVAGVDVWTTLVSVPPSAELSTASRWLRHKFALQDGAQRTGTPLRIADAEDGRARDDVGLVVFECAGSEDVARLERLEHAPCVQRTRYAPRLLLLAWRADAVHAAHAHTLQPVRKRVWTDVAILVLDDAQRDTDQAFRQALDLLVPAIAWNDARRQRTLRQATLPLWHHWVSAADSCERLLVSAMAVLPSAAVTRATASDAAALATFALSTLTALSNLLLRQVVAVCERRDDAPPVALPQVHRDTPAARTGEAVNLVLAELALEQLDDPAWRDDATVALLRANVVQCREWKSRTWSARRTPLTRSLPALALPTGAARHGVRPHRGGHAGPARRRVAAGCRRTPTACAPDRAGSLGARGPVCPCRARRVPPGGALHTGAHPFEAAGPQALYARKVRSRRTTSPRLTVQPRPHALAAGQTRPREAAGAPCVPPGYPVQHAACRRACVQGGCARRGDAPPEHRVQSRAAPRGDCLHLAHALQPEVAACM